QGAALDFEFEQIGRSHAVAPGESETEVAIRPSTGTFGEDVKNAKAFTGRVAVSPMLGQEFGGSWYFGRYTPSFLPSENLWAFAADWKNIFGPFEIEGEYVFTHFAGIRNVATGLARVARDSTLEGQTPGLNSVVEFELADLATNKQGYWLELRYNFWPDFLSKSFLGWQFDDPKFTAVVRGEQVWLNGLVEQGTFGGGPYRFLRHAGSDRQSDHGGTRLSTRSARRLPARLRVHADQPGQEPLERHQLHPRERGSHERRPVRRGVRVLRTLPMSHLARSSC